jgi:hypothetical protein
MFSFVVIFGFAEFVSFLSSPKWVNFSDTGHFRTESQNPHFMGACGIHEAPPFRPETTTSNRAPGPTERSIERAVLRNRARPRRRAGAAAAILSWGAGGTLCPGGFLLRHVIDHRVQTHALSLPGPRVRKPRTEAAPRSSDASQAACHFPRMRERSSSMSNSACDGCVSSHRRHELVFH